ncbi:MAG: pyruvate dehydrogenase (acetyl-transferring), homodimeric type, partial [Armatimonadetes bacterium CG_4_9_14_3_um_filter_58_7]
ASCATLWEVAFNHFFRGKDGGAGDQIYFQGHAVPGLYARAFLEGRLSAEKLENFRHELAPGGGLSSYPHPWLMPDFWQFPTVSMGLGPIMSIYQARFARYLEDRGLKQTHNQHVWGFFGDGEFDEPESLGAISLAAREKLDNLIFVINCNLQRLDGPVRGNGKIIQELERVFRGAGWHCIKVVWGADWDPLLAGDKQGLLQRRMMKAVDGDYQKYSVEPGSYTRNHFFGTHPDLLKMVDHLSDEDIRRLRRGGHDPAKVYAAYHNAINHQEQPTVILAKTIKGYGLGEAGEGRNVSHQQKKLNEQELREFRSKFGIPIADEDVVHTPFFRPAEDSREMQYLRERRKALGGWVPERRFDAVKLTPPSDETLQEFMENTGDREVATTMAIVRLLGKLLGDKELGKYIVPIVPDEARTFGMETLFRQIGIYSHVGQVYEPVDKETLLYYREATDGQLLEEGITEAGCMSSFIAAGTSYSTHNLPMIPFFIFYSMFGFQRIGDLAWAAADSRAKGFMVGATAGRTTLAGEGLQHQDGHSHLIASTIPNLVTYDPAYHYEIALIVQDGIRRMYHEYEDVFYYITVANEPYPMPAIPTGAEDGILKGIYLLRPAPSGLDGPPVKLFGSAAILREAIKAQAILAETYSIPAQVYSVTSYKELRREALATDRWNRLHPAAAPRSPYIAEVMAAAGPGPVIAASDYVKLVAEQVAPWIPDGFTALGTDGFGRSENRAHLRRFFEVDAECIALAALHALAQRNEFPANKVEEALRELGIDPEKPNPVTT